MSQYHTRIINLSYRDEDLPTFSTQEEIDAWHAAVGRMVLYGMRKEAPEDTIQMVSMGLTSKPAELCASYHTTLPACAEKYGTATPATSAARLRSSMTSATSYTARAKK